MFAISSASLHLFSNSPRESSVKFKIQLPKSLCQVASKGSTRINVNKVEIGPSSQIDRSNCILKQLEVKLEYALVNLIYRYPCILNLFRLEVDFGLPLRSFAGQDYLQSYLEIICRAVPYDRNRLWVIVLVRSLDINKYEYFCICFIGIQFSNAWIYLVPSLMIQTFKMVSLKQTRTTEGMA